MVGWIFASVRIPLLLVLSTVWLVCLMILWLPHVRGAVRLVDRILGHAFLFVCGFFYIPLKRMTFRPGAGHVSLTLAKVGTGEDPVYPGDLLLCNSQSPIDIIYLCTKYSPTFTSVDCRTGKIVVVSRLRALLGHATVQFHGANHSQYGHGSLGKILSGGTRVIPPPAPIIVFPEGSTGNGRALLSLTARLIGLPPNQRIHLLGLKYIASDGGFMPTLPLPGMYQFIRFFIALTCQWYNTLHAKWINSASIYASEYIPSLDSDPAELATALSDVYCALLHTRSVTLGARQKHDFIRAYLSSFK